MATASHTATTAVASRTASRPRIRRDAPRQGEAKGEGWGSPPHSRSRAHDDVLRNGGRAGYRETVFTQTLDVQLNSLVHELLCHLPHCTGSDTAREVGRIGGNVLPRFFDDDQKSIHVHFKPA